MEWEWVVVWVVGEEEEVVVGEVGDGDNQNTHSNA
jgi:hypothetical protein